MNHEYTDNSGGNTTNFELSKSKLIGLILSFAVLIGILLLPTPSDLSTAGHRMIGILFFAIVLWISSAVSYPVSATMLTALTAVLLGTAPNIDAPTKFSAPAMR